MNLNNREKQTKCFDFTLSASEINVILLKRDTIQKKATSPRADRDKKSHRERNSYQKQSINDMWSENATTMKRSHHDQQHMFCGARSVLALEYSEFVRFRVGHIIFNYYF